MDNSNQNNTIQYKLQKYRNLSNNNPNNNTYTYKLQKYQSLLQSHQLQQSQKGGVLNVPNRTDIQTEQLIGKIKNMLKNDSSSLTGGNNNSYTGYRNMQYGGAGPEEEGKGEAESVMKEDEFKTKTLDNLLEDAEKINVEAIDINCDEITNQIQELQKKIDENVAEGKENSNENKRCKEALNTLMDKLRQQKEADQEKANKCVEDIKKEVNQLLKLVTTDQEKVTIHTTRNKP